MGLDLESLKNQISSMRSLVKQSKNHLINKLTREAKKLREKKGTEEQKKKNEKKADRLIDEVMIMKKVQPDEVSKFILKTENCNQIMSKPDNPLEIKVLARFGTHKILSPVIEKFHSEHPSWKEDMNTLLEQLPMEPKQKVPSLNTSLNRSIVKTAGNNVFSVTPVKQPTNVKVENKSKTNDKQSMKDGAKIPEVAKTKKKNINSSDVISNENLSKHSPNKAISVAGTPASKYKSVFDSKDDDNKLNSKKRKSFLVGSSSDSDEDEHSDGAMSFSKKIKKQKTDEYSSEDSEDEESDADEFSDEEEKESSNEEEEEESSDEEFSFNRTDKNQKTDKPIISGQKQPNKDISFGKKAKNQQNDESKIPALNHKSSEKINKPSENNQLTNKTSKQAKLNKDLDEIEERLSKRKFGSKKESKDETVVEESVDPFFVTTEGEEYISSAPIPKTEDRPPASDFSHNASSPKEFYRKGKKITPSPHGYQKNFNDRNSRKSYGNYQDRNNSYPKNDRRNSFNDRFSANNGRGSFNNKFNRNGDQRASFNNKFNRNNDQRGSFNNKFNKNDDQRGSFNNKFNRNDDQRGSFNNKFNRNDDQRGSFNNKFNRNDDQRGSFKNKFNANSKFYKNDSKFNSRNQDSGSSEHIHPSWEAKKKMSTLAPFQGIKTVFNE